MSSTPSTARRRTCALAACLALSPLASLTACSGEAAPEEQPRLPAAVAADLAARSDRVAELLAAGDTCGAAVAADELHAAALAAINAGDVPPAFQEELAGSSAALVHEVNCPPPAVAEDGDEDEEDDGDGKGKGKKKGKEKKQEKDDD